MHPGNVPELSELLRIGGIHHDIRGSNKSSVLQAIVARLPVSPNVDRDVLRLAIALREAQGSTAVGEGIAIPHIRESFALGIRAPLVTLCLLARAVPFGASDGRPVDVLVTIISPTVAEHLQVVAKTGFALRDAWLRQLLEARGSSEEIVEGVRSLESRLATDR